MSYRSLGSDEVTLRNYRPHAVPVESGETMSRRSSGNGEFAHRAAAWSESLVAHPRQSDRLGR
jgi:hypothetical protein